VSGYPTRRSPPRTRSAADDAGRRELKTSDVPDTYALLVARVGSCPLVVRRATNRDEHTKPASLHDSLT
jgi:hypothetical protein